MKTLAEYAERFAEHSIKLAGGASVHYREANPRGKKTIIVVHGITGTHYSMLQMAGVWAERGDHIIAVDLPGHGRSDRISISEFTHMADWLNEVIETLHPAGDFVLVGNSFGSSVCAVYVQQYGLRGESGLVLGAPIPTINKVLQKLEKASSYLPERLIKRLYYENVLFESMRMGMLLGDLRNPLYRARLRDMIRDEAGLVQHGYAFGHLMPHVYVANPLESPLIEDIRRRTRVVHGDRDRIAGADVNAKMRLFAGDENVIAVRNAGHLVHLEAIPELTRTVDELS